MLTAERLREVAVYDHETGVFSWKIPRRRVRVGAAAGTVSKRGYIDICVDCQVYKAHRLAWLYTYGEWPVALIDHINGDKTDNRLANLRPATKAENGANRTKHESRNTSGYRGVHWDKRGQRWVAHIKQNGVGIHIGSFRTPAEASAAHDLRARKVFGEFYQPIQSAPAL
jgi:hypothetical protein